MSESKWNGTTHINCQLCGGKLGKVFYDANMTNIGPWMIIGHCCFKVYQPKMGQKYSTKTLIKIKDLHK